MVHQENLKTEKSTSFSIWNMKSISLCFKTFSYPPVRLKEWGFCFSKAICYTCRLIRTHSRQQKWGADNVKMLCRSIAERRPVFLSCTSSLDLRLEAFLLEFGGAHSFWHWKHMVSTLFLWDVLIITYPLVCLEKLALLSSLLSTCSKQLLCGSP